MLSLSTFTTYNHSGGYFPVKAWVAMWAVFFASEQS